MITRSSHGRQMCASESGALDLMNRIVSLSRVWITVFSVTAVITKISKPLDGTGTFDTGNNAVALPAN